MVLNHDVACKRLRAVGLTQNDTLQILDLIHKWTSSSGEEWTIKRLKALKVAYINKLARHPEPFVHSPWIKLKSGRRDIPAGIFGRIFKIRKVQKALSALMVYTSYTSKVLTEQQLKKFKTAVTSVYNGTNNLETIKLPIIEQVDELVNSIKKTSITNFYKIKNTGHSHPMAFSERNVRIPFVNSEIDPQSNEDWRSVELIDSVKTVDNNLNDFLSSFSHPFVEDYFEKNFQDKLPSGIEETLYASAFIGDNFSNLEILSVGRIGFIQEPGYKLRTVANPFPSIQVALSRLGNKVYSILKDIPTDCTFNQEKAIEDVQEYFNSNENTSGLMSIDLSSATDRFPLFLQEDVLHRLKDRGLLEEEDINLFSKVSRSEFTLPDGSHIKWETGQPLGVYPSFGVFALTHNMLAQSVRPKFFRILGDDIVIDSEAGKRLREKYTALGLVISEDKSIDSKNLAEFGGRLISKDKSYVQPKWKDISDHSFIDLARNLGPKSLGMFKPRQQYILKKLADVLPTVHPWGLNWNRNGLPYKDRLGISEDIMRSFLTEDKDLVEVRKDQINLRNLKWGIQVKEFFDFPFLLEQNQDTVEETTRNLISSALVASLNSNKSLLIRDTLNQFGLSCSDAIHSSEWNRVLKLNKEEFNRQIKDFGFGQASQITSGDPRGPSTLEVAEKKLKKPKGQIR